METLAADRTYLPANVSRDSWIDVEIEVEQSMQSYLDRLDAEMAEQPGFKKPPVHKGVKRHPTSKTDGDSGYIHHGDKRGVGYLMEATVDCKSGILTGVDVYSANQKESLLVLRHLEKQIEQGIPMQRIALDKGYDTLEDDYVGDWDCIYITVGRCTSQNRNAFETEIWNIRLETISELRYFEVRENRYVLNRVLGTK